MIDVHAMTFIISDPVSKTPLYLANVSRDITEYKQAVEALRASEELYARLVDTIPDVIIRTDLNGKILFVNDQTLKISGYSLEEIEGQDLLFFVAPEDRGRLTQNVWLMRNGRVGPQEYRLIMKDGREIPFEVNGDLLRNEDGMPFCIVTVWRDLTERKQMEESLKEESTRRQILFDQSPDGILIIDPETARFQDFNRAAHQQLGYSREEFTQLNIFDVEVEETAEETKARIAEVLRNGRADFETLQRTRNGELRNVQVTAQIVDIQGHPAYHCIWRDITERITAERERMRLEKQIQQAQKMEAIGTLAGGIAHDFNNLLMAILGYADLAVFSLAPTSPACQYVEEITKASQRAADLCRQMLAYSGKGRFVISRYDLSEIVREMGKILDVSVSKKAVLSYNLAEGLPAVESDITQIRQVIMNLIVNAADALGDARGIITVTTGVMKCDEAYLSESYLNDDLPGGTYVYLEVSDTGCGMDAATRSRIFDPFFTTKFVGRGLGLAAVLGIVRDHRGAIKVIDDDPFVVAVASAMLEKLGFEVLTAVNGREGLQVFRIHRGEITCVLLDLMMPEMGGEETLQELRNLQGDLPVILSSGFNEQDVTQRFVGKGLAGFIQKPYSVANLSRVLKSALG